MFGDGSSLDHTCPQCGGRTIWITRAGEQNVEGCPRCTQVAKTPQATGDWISGDLEIDEHANDKPGD
jgi:hypothetical protein